MIGWYAHHHGRGHLQRAAAVLDHMPGEATVLSSATVPPGLLPDGVGVLSLARDDDEVGDGTGPIDPTAHGMLHWVPLRHPGHRERMARIAGWIDATDARALVVDVSVEVTLLGRLLGTPVVATAMPGHRPDPAHALGHTAPAALLAAWPDWVPAAPHLSDHTARLHRVGGISRFAGRARPAPSDDRTRVVILGGAGGSAAPAGYWATAAARIAASGRGRAGPEVTIMGGTDGEWVDDPWPLLCGADLVVTHAGQNAVADVAAAGVPAVVIPEPRPFDEQRATADILRTTGLAVVVDTLPAPGGWPALVAAVLGSSTGDPARARENWVRWQVDGAAARAAAVVAEVAR